MNAISLHLMGLREACANRLYQIKTAIMNSNEKSNKKKNDFQIPLKKPSLRVCIFILQNKKRQMNSKTIFFFTHGKTKS